MTAAHPVSDDVKALARDFTAFGLTLHGHLPAEGNCFYSPLGIAIALSMLVPGARGRTLEELAAVLQVDGSGSDLSRHIAELIGSLSRRRAMEHVYNFETHVGKDEERDVFRLHLANALYAKAGYDLRPDYEAVVRDAFQAQLEALDVDHPDAAAAAINAWVAAQTQGMITNLIDPELIKPLTRLILVNAVYFFAEWTDQFTEETTVPRPFHLSAGDGGDTVDVPMMHGTRTLAYADDAAHGVQAVEIPYKATSMLVLLPAEGRFDAVAEQLSAEFLGRLYAQLASTLVELQLPRFELESSLSLKDALGALGVQAAFEQDAADFSGITDDTLGLVLSEVIHRARVRVDENGTEAAAATALVAVAGSADDFEPPKPIPFIVNRPFFFFIRDDQTGTVLFVGRVRNPGE